MRIGELAKAAGISTRALRYYEEQGLLPAERRANGYREYDEQAVLQVAFIQDLYRAGLTSEIIREIIPCAGSKRPDGDCDALVGRVRQVRDQLAQQEKQLAERREMLERYLSGAALPAGLDSHLDD
ncbi:MerR family transcriptional regulator [Streptomyces sp. AK02-01A]|uniref:MerR family transcriptional regulator n=1 Tax=Streptomyces sp. AK02-01A TaxID=3028648 RepID=UPI0029B5FE18|nr:MerR family transcriptional regulator [Streptomyces sp. AK02-01A]MDX3853403.1 MerR family transcriptional regulator [Streptomyces sp. AK02-01A]